MTSLCRFFLRAISVTGVAAISFIFFASPAGAAATIVVNSNADTAADDGVCTLREAIVASNSNTASGVNPGECVSGDSGADVINFNITGTADFTIAGQNGYTIQPSTGLPNISETVTINGYSQPGALANTAVAPQPLNGRLLIELKGSPSLGMPSIQANSSIIRGLVINSFDSSGLILWGDDIQVLGNYIGTDPTGLVAQSNALNGINGHNSGTSDRAIIGSTNPADRNVISGNAGAGITPNTGEDGWIVKGNYIGMGADGVTQVGNSAPINGPGGMSIDNCSDTVVGGTEVGAINVISGNKNFGIFPDNTTNLKIQGNIIGPDWKGDPIPGNVQLGGIGFPALNGPFVDTLIGGTNPGEGNIIAHNNGTGIAVIKVYIGGVSNFDSINISIIGNSIYSNASNNTFVISESGLGIDLLNAEFSNMSSDTLGPTPNDVSDADTGANHLMNYPVLNSAIQNAQQLNIDLDLDVADSPVDQYRVEIFANDAADPSGYGEGQTYLGYANLSPGDGQDIQLNLAGGTDLTGKVISATTTAIDNTATYGFGSTSEFSLARSVSITIATNESLATTGAPVWVYGATALGLLFTGAIGMYLYHRRYSA